MKYIIVFFLFFAHALYANSDSLDTLLEEYESTSLNSLQTVDEKMGHVVVYSQRDIRLMQYDTLDDILKELPRKNLNKNRFGVNSSALSGTSVSVSGFFRFFINDHEISSIHTQSSAITWGDMPLDFVDYIEVYYGDSSFALGNTTGVYFIRIYTKNAQKINGGEIIYKVSDKGSNTQSVMHSQTLSNGWSYLFFASRNSVNDESESNYSETIDNDSQREYYFLDLGNDRTKINLAYSSVDKDSYLGLSKNLEPDEGVIKAESIYFDVTQYFLDDKSLKLNLSYDVNNRFFHQENEDGLAIVPVRNPYIPVYNVSSYTEDLELSKKNLYLSKSTQFGDHTLFTAFNYTKNSYKVKNRKYTETSFMPTTTTTDYSIGHFKDFEEESIYSFLLQDEYRPIDDLVLIGNLKLDRYKRNDVIDDSTETLYRAGFIYTPTQNFGLKGFYNKTYIPPSFYNIDFVSANEEEVKTQKYRFYTLEGVYTTENSKTSLQYNNIRINDFVYLTPIGFINVPYVIRTEGFIFNYEYLFNNTDKLQFNYFVTTLNRSATNSDRGGFLKYMAKKGNFEYFGSVVYRNSYDYEKLTVPSSFDMNLGATYYFSNDISLGLKVENVLDKSTKTIFADMSDMNNPEYYMFKDRDRSAILTFKWVF